ncbi:hypothetical protein DL98DRAFT_661621 [Cadophora sp. DSE1049]|nr:hypothetical protein DL98DRAFT_661621 [Cadophora sp. DSE1049]
MLAARSSTGCWTCRLRKKKCQEERPNCSTCDTLSIICHGYGEKPAWMDGGPSEKSEARRIKTTIQENKKHKRSMVNSGMGNHGKQGPTKFSWMEVTSPALRSTKSTSLVGTFKTNTGANNESQMPSCLSCSVNSLSNNHQGREATLLMHYLDVVFPLQFRFYRPLVSEGGRGWLLSMLLRTKPLYHAALSLSAYHQSAVYTHPHTKTSDSILVDLQKHHSLALVELRKHIDRLSLEIGLSQMNTKVEILACMICLISFEVFKGHSNDWQTHLKAARLIFMDLKNNFLLDVSTPERAKGDSESPNSQLLDFASLTPEEGLALEFFATALIWFDGISAISTGAQSEYSDVYPSILQLEHGRIQLCKLMGSQNWVMNAIMDIALLAQWKDVRESCSDLSQSLLAKRAASIEERLEHGMQNNRNRHISDVSDPCGVRAQESKFVTHAFACAAKVYLYVVQSGAYPRIPEVRGSVLEALKVFQDVPDVRWLRYLVWPFCVVSCMAEEQHEQDFRQIAALTGRDGEIFCNFKNASSIMEECWRCRKDQPCLPWSWTTAMSSLGVETLLV